MTSFSCTHVYLWRVAILRSAQLDSTQLGPTAPGRSSATEVWKKIHVSSIYHRHIEHFFHIFGGSTVFSLISESTRRL